MSTEISISKKTVGEFLSEGKKRQFLIPEYQRPYAWTDDQVITLFEDIWEFMITKGGFDNEQEVYFLGSIVSFENKIRQVTEIIDSQQRLTSLCLLLRAIYAMIEGKDGKSAKNIAGQIEPTLWKKDVRTGDVDKTQPLFRSEVISDEGNENIRYILMTGKVAEGAKDNYSRNYKKFQSLLQKANSDSPDCIEEFAHTLLNQVIVLPIIADTRETALTIFSTLNNRGLPLSDADIFKAEIYDHLQTLGDNQAKDRFIADWKNLDERSENAGISLQALFTYDMFFERAQEGDDKTTTPGVRKYFLDEKNRRLYAPDLIERLGKILDLFEVINKDMVSDDMPWTTDEGISGMLDILKSYSNEFWKYPVISYFLKHGDEAGFKDSFVVFLKRLIAFLTLRYLASPTINAVKGDVLKLDVSIVRTDTPVFPNITVNDNELRPHIIVPHGKILRMLLKILAYSRQTKLLPKAWDIEHVLPRKWENGYFPKESESTVREKVEHFGNKVPFETVKNIKASNGFFGKKKELYKTSAIQVVRDLVEHDKWGLDEIGVRDVHASDDILRIMKEWMAL